MIEKILIINLLCNVFLLGMFFEHGICWRGEERSIKVANIILMILILCFGVFLQVILWGVEWGRLFVIWLGQVTQIQCYWRLFILGGWRSISNKKWGEQNQRIEDHKKKGKITLADRHFIYIMKILNKKRNYIHKV